MKPFIINLIVLLLISGCTTSPKKPVQHENKFVVQLIAVDTSTPVDGTLTVKKILNHPKANIYEFPDTYVELEKSERNDQSYTILVPEEHAWSNGHHMPEEEVPRFFEIVIFSMKNEIVDYRINIENRSFTKFGTLKHKDGSEEFAIYCQGGQIDREVRQAANKWEIITGLETDTDGVESQSSSYFCVKIIPPKQISTSASDEPADIFDSSSRYIPAYTVYKKDEIPPNQAMTMAKHAASSYYSDSLDINSGYIIFHNSKKWFVDFTYPKLKESGHCPWNAVVSVDKKSGKITHEQVE